MSDLTREARRFRAAVLRGDQEAARRLMAAYRDVYRRLTVELDAAVKALGEARSGGGPVSPARIYRVERITRLREQATVELTRYAAQAQQIIDEQVDTTRREAVEGAARMVGAVTPPGITASTTTLNVAAINQAVANLSPRGPLARLFATFGADGAADLQRALITGLATGAGPEVVGRQMRQVLARQPVRAVTIARTEIMRAHREAARQTFRNEPTVRAWVWVAGLGSRTCASCWAQHGTIHPLDEVMATHPRCRCVMAPVTVPWSELGYPGLAEPDPVPAGPDLFARQPESVQRMVLGPSKFAAYQRGEVGLEDFVATRTSLTWGRSTSEGSLRAARAKAGRRA